MDMIVAYWPTLTGIGGAVLAGITTICLWKARVDSRLGRLEEKVKSLATFWSSRVDN